MELPLGSKIQYTAFTHLLIEPKKTWIRAKGHTQIRTGVAGTFG